ncbi:MAG TPA: HEAT repeat domain-containing protein [Planctomycetota bacterium]|nr:HEAT repeat domain-containing protein [Planctomycetota bacterium]
MPLISLLLAAASAQAFEELEFEEENVAAAPLPQGAIIKSSPAPGQDRIVISSDGKLAATSGKDGQLHVYDAESAKLRYSIKAHEGGCFDVEFSANDKTLFSCGADTMVREWDLELKKETRKFEGHGAAVRNVAVTQDGRLLASSDAAGTIRVWDLKSGTQIHRMEGHGVELPPGVDAAVPVPTIDALYFSPDGRTLLSEADDETARLWDVVKGKRTHTLRKHDGSVAAIAIADDGAHGASTRGQQATRLGSHVRVWSVADGKMQRLLVGHTADVNCVSFSPDSRYVYTGSKDRTLRQWEVDSGLELRRWTLQSAPMGIVAAPDGKRLLSVSPREGVVIWKLDAPPLLSGSAPEADAKIEALWQTLANTDYRVRANAMSNLLTKDKDELVKFIEAQLKQAPKAEDAAAVEKAIQGLDDDNYSVRLEAMETLEQLRTVARPRLQAALDSPSPEVRVAAATVLQSIGGPYDVQRLMTIELLPLIGTPLARELLAKLAAQDTPEAPHARAVLKRWPK